MRNFLKRALVLLLACTMLPLIPANAAGSTGFSDVEPGEWYADELDMILTYTPGLISGYGDGTFRPGNTLKRGEFLRIAMTAAQGYTADKSRDSIHWAATYYTMALENNILVSDVYEGGVMFPCTFEALEQPISRYEMAVIVNNICTNMFMEKTVIVSDAADYIPDYTSIAGEYVNAVEQAYGKGILSGYGNTAGLVDGSFGGDRNLSRSQAVIVAYRLLWSGDRTLAGFAKEQEIVQDTGAAPEGFVSFAQWLQQGHIDSYGNLDTEARIALFGDANKTCFRSASEAAPFMVTVTVPIWTMDKMGNKSPSTAAITVHRLVADEVSYIFREIYDDPERFPIYGGWSVGGSRYTDTMRHSWGCAIDVNAYYNCECTVNWNSGTNNVTCGYGWWPAYTDKSVFSGSMSGPSEYSINPSGSVVRAFAKYGWGWGGKGYSLRSNGNQKFDYMHFSVLPSGG